MAMTMTGTIRVKIRTPRIRFLPGNLNRDSEYAAGAAITSTRIVVRIAVSRLTISEACHPVVPQDRCVAVQPQVGGQMGREGPQRVLRLEAHDDHPDDRRDEEEQQEHDAGPEGEATQEGRRTPAPPRWRRLPRLVLLRWGSDREPQGAPAGRAELFVLGEYRGSARRTALDDGKQGAGDDDEAEQQDRDRRRVAEAQVLERGVVDRVDQDRGVVAGPAAREAVQQVEHLQADDDLEDAHHDQRGPDGRQRDEPERLPGRGAVHLGGAVQGRGDRLRGRPAAGRPAAARTARPWR